VGRLSAISSNPSDTQCSSKSAASWSRPVSSFSRRSGPATSPPASRRSSICSMHSRTAASRSSSTSGRRSSGRGTTCVIAAYQLFQNWKSHNP
jgi:hypothetical protein